jgi:hypothetical protein
MTPVVTVLLSPIGAPIATEVSPTLSFEESAKVTGLRPLAPSSLITARS